MNKKIIVRILAVVILLLGVFFFMFGEDLGLEFGIALYGFFVAIGASFGGLIGAIVATSMHALEQRRKNLPTDAPEVFFQNFVIFFILVVIIAILYFFFVMKKH